MSLTPPSKVWKLQRVLRAKAKESPDYRFYLLYDKIYRADVLEWAYLRCRANGGSAGVDGQTFDDIEKYGRQRWLDELAQELRNKTYRPAAVRRVWIPKADGKQRPLGIPTVRDRVVQMAFVIVVEPIFDEDLQPEQHAYRPKHDAHQALREVQSWLDRGYTEVVDADLSGYFDSIPHHELMKCVARRISDRHVLHLVKMWLEAPVEETGEEGRKVRTTRNKDEGRGTPQGGVASPLLANLYMRRFVLGWKKGGHEQRLDAHIVNYADDFVICCRPGRGLEAMTADCAAAHLPTAPPVDATTPRQAGASPELPRHAAVREVRPHEPSPDDPAQTSVGERHANHNWSGSRMREIRTSGSMSGDVETEHGTTIEAPEDERSGNR